jgi:hypothetical protein
MAKKRKTKAATKKTAKKAKARRKAWSSRGPAWYPIDPKPPKEAKG